MVTGRLRAVRLGTQSQIRPDALPDVYIAPNRCILCDAREAILRAIIHGCCACLLRTLEHQF